MDNTSKLRALELARIFSPYTHSPYTISRFTSYLNLLLLPEVKYGERLLPVGKKKRVTINTGPGTRGLGTQGPEDRGPEDQGPNDHSANNYHELV